MLRLLLALFLLAVATVGFAADSQTLNWPQFRGADGTGVSPETELPIKFDASNVVWKSELPVVGHSSPIVWGSRIFLTGAHTEGRRRAAARRLSGPQLGELVVE